MIILSYSFLAQSMRNIQFLFRKSSFNSNIAHLAVFGSVFLQKWLIFLKSSNMKMGIWFKLVQVRST